MNTTFYAEFNSSGAWTVHLCLNKPELFLGPGGNTSARISLDHILTEEEAKNFTVDKVFLERPGWIDFEYAV